MATRSQASVTEGKVGPPKSRRRRVRHARAIPRDFRYSAGAVRGLRRGSAVSLYQQSDVRDVPPPRRRGHRLRDEDLMPVQFTQVYLPVLCQAITSRTPQMAECAFAGAFGTLSYIAVITCRCSTMRERFARSSASATTSRPKNASSASYGTQRGDRSWPRACPISSPA